MKTSPDNHYHQNNNSILSILDQKKFEDQFSGTRETLFQTLIQKAKFEDLKEEFETEFHVDYTNFIRNKQLELLNILSTDEAWPGFITTIPAR